MNHDIYTKMNKNEISSKKRNDINALKYSHGSVPKVIKLFMLNSTEHKIYHAHKC